MRLFIRQTFIFITPVILLIILFESLLRCIPNDYKYKKEYLSKKASQIEYLFLGNSHVTYGVKPSLISPKAFNLSHVSQSLDIDSYIFNAYKFQLKSLKKIIISVDYFSFHSSLAQSSEPWRLKNYVLYLGLTKPFGIKHYFYSELLDNIYLINKNRLTSYYMYQKNPITCLDQGWSNSYIKNKKPNFEKDCGYSVKRHTIKTKLSVPLNYKGLNSIIDFAQKNNIEVILVTFPTTSCYASQVDAKQMQFVLNTINAMKETHLNVSHLNFMTDTDFTLNDFYDTNHLNEKGAEKLSLKLRPYVLAQ